MFTYQVTFCNYTVALTTTPAILKITWVCCTSIKLKQQQHTLLSWRNFGSSNSPTIVYSSLLPMGSNFGSNLQKNKQLVSHYYVYFFLHCTLRIKRNAQPQTSNKNTDDDCLSSMFTNLVTFCNYKVPLRSNPAISKSPWVCCTSMKHKQQRRSLISWRNFGSTNSLFMFIVYGVKFGSNLEKNKQLVSFYYLYSILYCTLGIKKQ